MLFCIFNWTRLTVFHNPSYTPYLLYGLYTRSGWLILGHYSPVKHTDLITGLLKDNGKDLKAREIIRILTNRAWNYFLISLVTIWLPILIIIIIIIIININIIIITIIIIIIIVLT